MATVFELTENILYDGGEMLPHDISINLFSSYEKAFEYMYITLIEDINEHIEFMKYTGLDKYDKDDEETSIRSRKYINCSYNTCENIKTFLEEYNSSDKFKDLIDFKLGYQIYIDNYDDPILHRTK